MTQVNRETSKPGDGTETSLTVTSRAVWGVQLLSNKMKWEALWWPRTSQYDSKWRAKIFAWDFVAFDVPLICTSSALPYERCHRKILPPPPQAPRCASSNSAWIPMPMPHELSAITKVQNETVLAFSHCTFWYMKISRCFSHRFNLQCNTDIDRLWLPWFCPCNILTEWMTSTVNFEEWNRLIKCKLDWLGTFLLLSNNVPINHN